MMTHRQVLTTIAASCLDWNLQTLKTIGETGIPERFDSILLGPVIIYSP